MKHHFVKILFMSLLLFVPACGVWQNFTTYFNLYYNTSEAFQQAEEAIFLQERGIFDVEDIKVPASANQLLTKVIEKTSKILQFHGTTAFVDDALLMLGKSFYYQKNYLQAQRKFLELTSTQKESDLYLEAVLWTGKTQMALRDYDNGLLTLDSLRVLAAEEGEDELVVESFIEEVIYNIKRENFLTAVEIADELLSVSDDEEQQGEILYETGRLYKKLNEPEKALEYFHRVQDNTTKYNVERDALLEEGRTLRELGRNEKALELFENMRLEDKYRENYDVVDYEIGTTYMLLGRTEDAVDNFVYIDTSYATSQYTGLARYNIGQIYENEFLNYDSASVYYQKAASSQLPVEKVKEVHGRNQLFVKYDQISKKVNDAERQLVYKENPEEFIKDSTSYADSLKILLAADSLESLRTQSRSNQRVNTPLKQQITLFRQQGAPRRSPLSKDSLTSVINRNKFDLANLFFAELGKPDSAVVYYTDLLEDTSASEFHSRTLYALGDYYFQKGDTVKADSLFNFIYENYRTDRVANAAALRLNKPTHDLTYDPAEEIFTEAEKLWKEENYDTSFSIYYSVYENFPKSALAPKALLAGGWILENDLQLPDSAASVYDILTSEYAGTPYALKIGPKIIAYKQEEAKRQRAVEDSIRAANQPDSLQNVKQPVVVPDSLSEAEKLRMETEKAKQDNTGVDVRSKDSLKIQEPKPDTLQPDNRNRERRNPRRRG